MDKFKSKIKRQIMKHSDGKNINDRLFSNLNLSSVNFDFTTQDMVNAIFEVAEILIGNKKKPDEVWPIVIVLLLITKERIPVVSEDTYRYEINKEIITTTGANTSVDITENFFCEILCSVYAEKLLSTDKDSYIQLVYNNISKAETILLKKDYLEIPTFMRRCKQ